MNHESEIRIPYDRQLTDSDITAVTSRLVLSISVLNQLGTDYHTLPRHAKADLEAKEQSIKGKSAQLKEHITAIGLLLPALDTEGAEVDAVNKSLLHLLRGMLAGTPEESLLDQITGPTAQGGTAATPATP